MLIRGTEKVVRRRQRFEQTTSLNDRLLMLAREAEKRAAASSERRALQKLRPISNCFLGEEGLRRVKTKLAPAMSSNEFCSILPII
jgi:hypothetical protein